MTDLQFCKAAILLLSFCLSVLMLSYSNKKAQYDKRIEELEKELRKARKR